LVSVTQATHVPVASSQEVPEAHVPQEVPQPSSPHFRVPQALGVQQPPPASARQSCPEAQQAGPQRRAAAQTTEASGPGLDSGQPASAIAQARAAPKAFVIRRIDGFMAGFDSQARVDCASVEKQG
jgi:hypothetical protein